MQRSADHGQLPHVPVEAWRFLCAARRGLARCEENVASRGKFWRKSEGANVWCGGQMWCLDVFVGGRRNSLRRTEDGGAEHVSLVPRNDVCHVCSDVEEKVVNEGSMFLDYYADSAGRVRDSSTLSTLMSMSWTRIQTQVQVHARY